MSENIEKAVQTEELPETKKTETTTPAATDNVVLYPVSDEQKNISASQETTDTETAASEEITDTQNADNPTVETTSEQAIDNKTTDIKTTDIKTTDTKTADAKTADTKTADTPGKFSDTQNTKERSKTDAHHSSNYEKDMEEDEDLEEDFYEQQENSAPEMNILSVSSSLISVPNARLK